MSYSYVEEDCSLTPVTASGRGAWLIAGLRVCVLTLLRVLAFSTVTAAQSLTSGALHVRIMDEQDNALRGAGVTLYDRATGVARSLRPGSGGQFAAPLIPAGEYDVVVEVLGYRPQRWINVTVVPGRAADVAVHLVPMRPPILRVDTIQYVSVTAPGISGGLRQFVPERLLNDLPGEGRELTELARLSSVMDADRASEGLPSSWTGMLIDGVGVARSSYTGSAPDPFRASAFPLSEFSFAEVVRNDADVEWAALPGPQLSAHTRTGTQNFAARTFGTFGSSALSASGAFDGRTPAFASGNGGILISGPIVHDTAHFVIGIEAQRLERALPRLWEQDDTLDARLVAIAQKSFALDLQSYTQPRVITSDVLSGFARLDWQLTSAHRLDVRASGATMPRILARAITPSSIPDDVLKGSELSAAVTVTSELTSHIAHELRVAVEHSVRDAQPGTVDVSDTGVVNASTHIVQGALDFGGPATLAGHFAQSSVSAAQTLHVSARAHRAKLGVSAALSSHDDAYPVQSAGDVFFGGLDQLARLEGMLVASSGPLRVATFHTLDLGAYAQDTWTPAAGLSITAGVRYDVTRLPQGGLTLNQRWLQLTGLSNTQLPDRRRDVSPRVGLHWDIAHGSSLDIAAGVYHAPFDPRVIAELLTQDGSVSVRRAAGTLSAWPAAAPGGSDASTASSLTLISPDFAAPRTSRASVALSQQVRAHTMLHISGTLRKTAFLARRTDLNGPVQAAGYDQYGRALFGALVQQGGLLFAKPASNRRFSEFDVVSALTSDGTSNYWDVTIAADHDVAKNLTLFGSYTHSHTTDDWPTDHAGSPDASFDPRLTGTTSTDWSQGTSDFDVPDRLVLGMERRFGGTLHPRIAGLYRYRSGSAFTPGFRAGVDANGDSFTRNDPAYIDGAIAGIEPLLAGWKCLRGQQNRFAARNSCREAGTHALDLRVTSQLARFGGAPAEFYIDALNVLDSQSVEPDAALLLIDPASALHTANNRTTVPYIANPHFGKPLLRLASGRAFRIGMRVNY